MPSPCCVPFCTTGLKFATGKVSFFSFPKDELLKEQWLQVIPCANLVVSSRLKICEKHFTKDHIKRTRESHSDMNTIVIKMKRPRLQANAIPSIFPLPPKFVSKGRKRLTIVSGTTNKINLNCSRREENAIPSTFSNAKFLWNGGEPKPVPQPIVTLTNSETSNQANAISRILVFPDPTCSSEIITIPDSPPRTTSIDSNKTDKGILGVTHLVIGKIWSLSEVKPCQSNDFSNIVKDLKKIILPKGWEYKFHCGKQSFVSFYVIIPYDDDTTGFLIERQISFGIDMVIQCKIFNKVFDLISYGIFVPTLPTVKNVSELINYLNEYQVCVGGPIENQYAGVSNSTSDLCVNGHWRHTKCAYLLHHTEIRHKRCIHCMNLRNALRIKKKKMMDNELNSNH